MYLKNTFRKVKQSVVKGLILTHLFCPLYEKYDFKPTSFKIETVELNINSNRTYKYLFNELKQANMLNLVRKLTKELNNYFDNADVSHFNKDYEDIYTKFYILESNYEIFNPIIVEYANKTNKLSESDVKFIGEWVRLFRSSDELWNSFDKLCKLSKIDLNELKIRGHMVALFLKLTYYADERIGPSNAYTIYKLQKNFEETLREKDEIKTHIGKQHFEALTRAINDLFYKIFNGE